MEANSVKRQLYGEFDAVSDSKTMMFKVVSPPKMRRICRKVNISQDAVPLTDFSGSKQKYNEKCAEISYEMVDDIEEDDVVLKSIPNHISLASQHIYEESDENKENKHIQQSDIDRQGDLKGSSSCDEKTNQGKRNNHALLGTCGSDLKSILQIHTDEEIDSNHQKSKEINKLRTRENSNSLDSKDPKTIESLRRENKMLKEKVFNMEKEIAALRSKAYETSWGYGENSKTRPIQENREPLGNGVKINCKTERMRGIYKISSPKLGKKRTNLKCKDIPMK